MLLASVFAFGAWQFSRIERVEVDGLAAGANTNILIVGSDSREGISADDETAGAFRGAEEGGERSDTMLVLRLGGDGARILSIPRDLLVTVADTDRRQRINAAYNGGPSRLVRTISDNLDLPVHRYMELDFVKFRELVNALGGVTVDFPHPAFDPRSGLDVERSGAIELDGDQALAYVRSRTYTEVIEGEERVDGTGDLGRIARQQAFLRAVLDAFSDTYNPIRLGRATSALGDGLRVDEEMSLLDAVIIFSRLRSAEPQPVPLPVDDAVTTQGARVLELGPGAEEVLDQFR